MSKTAKPKTEPHFAESAGRALQRAARKAREIARQHGTPIHVIANGKVVALKP